MHRAGAAEGDEREVARLNPLRYGQRPDRLRHLRVDHVKDPLGQLRCLEIESAGEPGCSAVGCRGVEGHTTAGERLGCDPAEDEVGVGDGWLAAAAPVAGWAWVCAGALRADA